MENLIPLEQLKMDTTHSISVWKKDGMIPGFIEGLEKLSLVIRPFYSPSHLAYAGGAGDVIPPNTNIV
jgi:FKBP-type peptidyl-prolyl cis-trans isomerase